MLLQTTVNQTPYHWQLSLAFFHLHVGHNSCRSQWYSVQWDEDRRAQLHWGDHSKFGVIFYYFSLIFVCVWLVKMLHSVCQIFITAIWSIRSQGEQGWRSGESARLLLMWFEFFGSLLCSERFFSGYSGFPLSLKKQHLIWLDWELIWFSLPN